MNRWPLLLILVISIGQLLLVSASHEANARLRESRMRASGAIDQGEQVLYPDYCWFTGLENRILFEYPELANLLRQHHVNFYQRRNLKAAVNLHTLIFHRIYQIELDKLDREELKANKGAGVVSMVSSSKIGVSNSERAAYKLFDLWANTPSDFEKRAGDYGNYLAPYLLQSQTEFWTYCLDDQDGCHEVLRQLIVLARERQLGPLELLQVSINIIMLMNSHKADLVLEKLIQHEAVEIKDERDYSRRLNDLVHLIETDDDFNEATFNYVYLNGGDSSQAPQQQPVRALIDSKIEAYFCERLKRVKSRERVVLSSDDRVNDNNDSDSVNKETSGFLID